MKAKKLMGVIACAGACVSLSALANTTNGWFGVSVNDTTVNAGSCSVTTNDVAVTSTGTAGKIVLDNDLDSALTITPASGNDTLSDGLVTITSSAVLTPSDKNDLELVAGAQAGFAVAVDNDVTNFYGYASASNNGEPAWNKLTGEVPAEGAATFSIVLDYRTSTVQFYKGDELLSGSTNNVATSSFAISNNFVNLNNIAAYGSGSINSITSLYEVAVAAVVSDGGATTNKYGSAAEAVVAAGDSGDVLDIAANGAATETKQAANGLFAWECEILGIAENEAIPLAPADEAVAGKITLKLNNDIPAGTEAKFTVQKLTGEAVVTEGQYPASAIQIPMATGTYTVTPVIKAAQ